MASEQYQLSWSSQFAVTSSRLTPKLPGDKIVLPQSALEQLLAAASLQEISSQHPSRQQQLPHPLTFRLVNPRNGRGIYAGIREFSAPENEIGLSASLREALDISGTISAGNSEHVITVHAKQLPKGTYVRLRPLEAGYDPEDWKALLERHLRDNYTTLTTGEVLNVPFREGSFKFLADRVEPHGEGICVVDTDLEVDIVALTEDQARETLQRRLAKASRAPGTKAGTSVGNTTSELPVDVTGQVLPGQYVDHELRLNDKTIQINLDSEDDVFLLVSPFSARQRNRPREDEFVFGDLSSETQKQISISPTNVELDGAESLYISVHAYSSTDQGASQPPLPLPYRLRIVSGASPVTDDRDAHDPDDVQCKNCQRWIAQRTIVLHENFCYRNNILCPQCNNVFQKREIQHHWHCPHDTAYGNEPVSQRKHDSIFHSIHTCHACGFKAGGLQHLAQHRTTVCPAKPILCLFCHLVVPQQGDSDPDIHDPEVLLSGLTPHELVDGGRTTECHLCNKIVRLRDMKTHLRHHDLNRLSRPNPQICLNQNCGRTIDTRGPQTQTLGLCSICFGPLYVDTYDPEGKALRRRIERRYLSQLMSGCGKPWCQNENCKTGKQNRQTSDTPVSTATALYLVRPLIDAADLQGPGPHTAPFYFCTDQAGQQRRVLADMLAAEGPETTEGKAYDLPWCVAAVEAAAGEVDKAREWLDNWAPARGEGAGIIEL